MQTWGGASRASVRWFDVGSALPRVRGSIGRSATCFVCDWSSRCPMMNGLWWSQGAQGRRWCCSRCFNMQLKTENISHYEMPKSNLLWNRTFVFCFQHKNPYGFMSIFKHLCLNVHELPTDVFPNECRSYNMSGVLFFTFSGDGGPRCSAFFSSRCVLLV